MSDAVPASLAAELARSDRQAYFEQRLFVLSPLGDFATALLLLFLLIGSFLAIAWSENVAALVPTADNFMVATPMRTAFALSVTLCTALFTQRHTRMRERADYQAFARVFAPGAMARYNIADLTPGDARLPLATALGLAGGVLVSIPLYGKYLLTPGIFAWLLIVTTLLFMAFARGVELSRTATRRSNLADHRRPRASGAGGERRVQPRRHARGHRER